MRTTALDPATVAIRFGGCFWGEIWEGGKRWRHVMNPRMKIEITQYLWVHIQYTYSCSKNILNMSIYLYIHPSIRTHPAKQFFGFYSNISILAFNVPQPSPNIMMVHANTPFHHHLHFSLELSNVNQWVVTTSLGMLMFGALSFNGKTCICCWFWETRKYVPKLGSSILYAVFLLHEYRLNLKGYDIRASIIAFILTKFKTFIKKVLLLDFDASCGQMYTKGP